MVILRQISVRRWLPRLLVGTLWLASAATGEWLFGTDIGRGARRIEHRIEERLEHRESPGDNGVQEHLRERSHEQEPIEPWELVPV